MHPLPSYRNIPPPELTSVEIVLFDAVGTLIFPDPQPAAVYQQIGSRHGVELPLDVVRDRFSTAFSKHHISGPTDEPMERRRWRHVIADVFEMAFESNLFDALWDHFCQPGSWKVFDDAAETFGELQRRNVPVGIASNFDARLLRLCRELPPLSSVHTIYYSAAVGWSKPRPEFFAAIQGQLGVEAAKILLVGDDKEKDLGGALNAGWQALLIDRSGQGPDGKTIARLTDIFKLID
jgi:putative hydrolase of the HAD superfamily